MAYSKLLAERVRHALSGRSGIVEKKMFGGVGFMLHGNMCVGVWKDSLIVRVGPDAYESALTESDVVEFDITGRSMRGWVMVQPDGVETDEQLRKWVQLAEEFVGTLPSK